MWSKLLAAFLIATSPYVYHFPADHYAHPAYQTEWWYFTGHLTARDGRRYGYELTFFRVGLEPRASSWKRGQSRWYAYQLYPAHFAITDERAGSFVYYETFARDALGAGVASTNSFHVAANGWTLDGTNAERPVIRLHAARGSEALDLTVKSEKPPAIHGIGGISKKAPCASCASHYYSFTRLTTAGTLRRGGERVAVSGISWMDHEYGSGELQQDQAGWDWFSLQMDDGREVMLYHLREKDGSTTPQSSGSLVDRRGAVTYLPLDAFSIAATAQWTSPKSGARYPARWNVRVRGIDAPLTLVPIVNDQELYDPSGTTYWEGAVDVYDARTQKKLGVGYVELTGYVAPISL